MANREKGEVALTINGQQYTLAPGLNALVAAEGAMSVIRGKDVSSVEIISAVQSGNLTAFRALFWGMLRKYHSGVTIEQAGELVDAFGGMDLLNSALEDALLHTQPDRRDVEALGVTKSNPRRARVNGGIGARSTSKPVASGSHGTNSGI